MTERQARSIHDEEVAAFRERWYRVEMRKAGELAYASDHETACSAEHTVDRLIGAGYLMRGRTITTDAPILSPFVRRALARELPGKVVR